MAKAVIQANIQTSSGAIYVAPSASIEIRDAGTGSLVQLWTDRDGAIPQVNPFNADVNGDFKVYATEGRVNISATYGGNTKTWNDVVVFESTKAVELSLKVDRTDATAGSAVLPSRTTTERDLDAPQTGYFGYNETTNKFEGYGSAGWASLVESSNIQKQDFTAFTTAGTSTAYTLTTSPALPALTTNESFRVTFHTPSGVAPTLARDGFAAKLLKQYNSLGVKVTAVVASGQISNVQYDGTDYVVLDSGSITTLTDLITNVRQTVDYGPVDANGFAAFGGSTGATTVTAAGTLYLTAANGINNRRGSITNPSWTGLSTNGTMYLYLDIASDGSCTTVSSTLAPIYQCGGTYSITNGQFTFNISEMIGKVGNGTVATQTYRVAVGQVVISGGLVASIVWYALNRFYDSGYTATLPAASTAVSKNHNIGTSLIKKDMIAECTTAELGYSIGDIISIDAIWTIDGSAIPGLFGFTHTSNTLQLSTNTFTIVARQKGGGSALNLTPTSWKYKFIVKGIF